MLGVVAEEERGRHLVVKMVMIAIRVVVRVIKRILLISTIYSQDHLHERNGRGL